MFFPVRCFTCGGVIGHLTEEYEQKVKAGKNPAEVLEALGIERYCCRRMFLGHVEVMDKVIRYERL